MIPACWRLGADTSLWQQIQPTNGSPKSVLATHLRTNVPVFFFMDIFRCNIYINIYIYIIYIYCIFTYIYIYFCIYNLSNLHSGHSFFLGLIFLVADGWAWSFHPQVVVHHLRVRRFGTFGKVKKHSNLKSSKLLWVFVGISGRYT